MQNQGDSKQTLIEAGTKFTGSFASDNPIVVRGSIEGEVTGPSLTVAETGSVSGRVKVKELYSRGVLSGEYEAENVHLSGTVRDQTVIRAKMLEVKLTAKQGGMEVVFGDVELEVGEMPSQEEAIAKSTQEAPTGTSDAIPADGPAAGATKEDKSAASNGNPLAGNLGRSTTQAIGGAGSAKSSQQKGESAPNGTQGK